MMALNDSESLPERLAREAVAPQRARIFGGSVPAGIRRATLERAIAAAIRVALDEAAKVARAGVDQDGGYAPDPVLNAALNNRTWAARRKIAAGIEALKGAP